MKDIKKLIVIEGIIFLVAGIITVLMGLNFSIQPKTTCNNINELKETNIKN